MRRPVGCLILGHFPQASLKRLGENFMSDTYLLISVNYNSPTTVTVNCDVTFVSLFSI